MNIEKFTNRLNFRVSLKMYNIGWDIWTPTQYICDDTARKTNLNLEACALAELMGKKIVYSPTYEQAYNYILSTNHGWTLNVEYNPDYDAWYFIIKNHQTGEYHNYEYNQPICPKMKYEDAYLWGLEHILNRYPENDNVTVEV